VLWHAISATARGCYLLRGNLRQANASAAARKKIGRGRRKHIGCAWDYGAASVAITTAMAIDETVSARTRDFEPSMMLEIADTPVLPSGKMGSVFIRVRCFEI
jgi:hypothetical protein